MKKRMIFCFALYFIFASGCIVKQENDTNDTSTQPAKEVTNPLGSSVETVAEKLDVPWAITKYKDTFYITERNGTIARISDGNLSRESVHLDKDVLRYGEGGLLGLALHPDFAANNQAFVYHTYGTKESVKNRLVLLKYENGAWKEERALLEDIPGAIYHNGGRIAIGPDNMLYVTVGDATIPEEAQNTGSLSGSILRMELDGSIPKDNPIPDSYVYSFGHRNPQGLAWDRETGMLYESEHGPSARDEINIIEPGKNYGWPVISGSEEENGMETPLFNSGTNTWAPSGLVYHNGSLFVASLRGEMIRKFELESKKEYALVEGFGRMRDVLVDGDTIYAVTNNTDGRGNPIPEDDRLIKIPLNRED
ncbi:glucose/arabinose dehydrogenase [Bacillus tianshenii]|uniref:Glucose/arabinose dehydrogenase n=1 Tax=Sutcliffiella tianshenii TaxID=1463404 RepID=A0ABS2NXA6_9BACI|nr:PQQ-dependent sugar dehydrogenase [Bacillus tianshenii]MBM7619293.1 glucose/arabinose dehydrogenase [Bacillus tianshenii]